jgi:hypothetical protein
MSTFKGGYLNLRHVRGVQVKAEWRMEEKERTEVWIFDRPKEG